MHVPSSFVASVKLHSQLTAASKTWVGVAFIMQSTKLVSATMNFATMNFTTICKIYRALENYPLYGIHWEA